MCAINKERFGGKGNSSVCDLLGEVGSVKNSDKVVRRTILMAVKLVGSKERPGQSLLWFTIARMDEPLPDFKPPTTYKPPIANAADASHFHLMDMLSFQICVAGRTNIHRSSAMLSPAWT